MNNIVYPDFKKKQREYGEALLQDAISILDIKKSYSKKEIASFYEEQIDPLLYNIQNTIDVDFIWIPSPFDKDYTV